MEFLTSLTPLSHSMAHFALKNAIFLMQKRLKVSTTTTHLTVRVSSSSYPPSPSTSFTVDYLVNSCGLPLKSAISASRLVQLKEENAQRHNAVLDLLKSYGFNDTEIARILEQTPKLLTGFKVEETLKPKLEFLVGKGLHGPSLRDLIVKNPRLLTRSVTSYIEPSIELLKSLVGTEERVWLAVRRNPRLLKNNLDDTLKPIIEILVKEGVAMDDMANFIVTQPNRMLPNVDRLLNALQTVKDQLGIDPSHRMFLLSVMMMASLGCSLWEKKMQVFQGFGFSQDDVLCIFRRNPNCMSRAEDTLRTKLDFYLNTVGLKRDDIVSYPTLLLRSIDSKSRPRHNVMKVLLAKKLLKEDAKLARLFHIGEEKFLKRYVLEHLEQVPDLLERTLCRIGKTAYNGQRHKPGQQSDLGRQPLLVIATPKEPGGQCGHNFFVDAGETGCKMICRTKCGGIIDIKNNVKDLPLIN